MPTTLIEFKDGHSTIVTDAYPSTYDGNLSFCDADCICVGEDIPLETVERITFDND